MATRTAALLGGEPLSRGHVCALVRDDADFYAALGPFIAEGLAAGERAVHLVGDRDDHLARLRVMGLPVDAALSSGQLEVLAWAEAHLRGGSFARTAMLEFVRELLDAGRRSGFTRTRIASTMEWAVDRPEWAAELPPYEAQLTALLRARTDVVVCAYDLRRHGGAVIAGVLDAHPLTLREGVLRAHRPVASASPRERILAAAHDHFHTIGIRATGIDALIAAAGVAKATFYRYFPSKDDLVVAWLSDSRPRWFYTVRARVEARGGSAAERILGVFEESALWHESDGFRGCAFQNASIEITDSTHPAWPVIRAYLDEVDVHFRELAFGAGLPEPARLAGQLATLLSGALVLSVAKRSTGPMFVARDAAAALIGRSSPGPTD